MSSQENVQRERDAFHNALAVERILVRIKNNADQAMRLAADHEMVMAAANGPAKIELASGFDLKSMQNGGGRMAVPPDSPTQAAQQAVQMRQAMEASMANVVADSNRLEALVFGKGDGGEEVEQNA